MTSDHRVKYVGVAAGATILFSFAPEGSVGAIEGVLALIFSSAGWAAVLSDGKTRLELKSGRDVFCVSSGRQCPRGCVA